MEINTGSDLYFNVQIWFARHILPELPNDDQSWASGFRKWLKMQGARIEMSPLDVSRNGVNVAIGHDRMVFDTKQDYLIFLLRWS